MNCIVIRREEWTDSKVEVEEALKRAGCTIVQAVPREGTSEVRLHCSMVPIEHVDCGHTVEFVGGPSSTLSDMLGFEAVMAYPLKCPACGERA